MFFWSALNRRFKTVLFGLLLLLSISSPSAEIPIGQKVQAACIYNFLRLSEWPPGTFSDRTVPLLVGVVGDTPLYSLLQEGLKGKLVNERPIKIIKLAELEEARKCQMILFSSDSSERAPEVLLQVRGAPVLTVAEFETFTQTGGMINFVKKDGEIHFAVNPAEVERASIKLSSQLLKLAILIKENPPK